MPFCSVFVIHSPPQEAHANRDPRRHLYSIELSWISRCYLISVFVDTLTTKRAVTAYKAKYKNRIYSLPVHLHGRWFHSTYRVRVNLLNVKPRSTFRVAKMWLGCKQQYRYVFQCCYLYCCSSKGMGWCSLKCCWTCRLYLCFCSFFTEIGFI